jgi:transcriptional regulator with XRE-family HTH domain
MQFNFKKLSEKRRSKGLSQEFVARAAGISNACIVSLENGKRKPKAETLANITRVLNTKLEYFFDID